MNIPAKFQGKGFFFLQQPISDMNCPCQEYWRLKPFAYGYCTTFFNFEAKTVLEI